MERLQNHVSEIGKSAFKAGVSMITDLINQIIVKVITAEWEHYCQLV